MASFSFEYLALQELPGACLEEWSLWTAFFAKGTHNYTFLHVYFEQLTFSIVLLQVRH